MSKLVRFIITLLILFPIACARLQLPTATPGSIHEVQSSSTSNTPQPKAVAEGMEIFPFEFSHASSSPQQESPGAKKAKTVGALSYSEQVQDTLNLYEVHAWQFNGAKGDVITADVHGNFDAVIELWLSDNRLEANDDNGQLDLSSRIKAYTLPESGTYTLFVRGFGSAHGQYQLQVIREAFDEMYSRAILQPGQVVKGYNTTETGTWSFEGVSGEWVVINGQYPYNDSAQYDPDDGIKVFASNGELVSPPLLLNSPFRLPTTDNYSLVVRHKGAYSLRLSKGSDEGDLPMGSLIDATNSGSLRSWHFQANAGERFSLVVVTDALKALNNKDYLFYSSRLEVKIVDPHGEVIEPQLNGSAYSGIGDQTSYTFQIPRTDTYTVFVMESVSFIIAKGDYDAPNYLADIEADKLREIELYPAQDYITDQIELKWLQAAGELGWRYEGDPFVIRGGEFAIGGTTPEWSLYGFAPFETLRLLFITDKGLIEHPIATAEDGTAEVVARIPQSESSIVVSELLVVNNENHIIRFRYWVEPVEPCPDGRKPGINPIFATRMMKDYQGVLVKNARIRYLWDGPLGNPISEVHESDTFDVTGDGKCTMLYDRDGTFKEFYWWPIRVHESNEKGWLIEGRNLGGELEEFRDYSNAIAWIRPLFLKNSSK